MPCLALAMPPCVFQVSVGIQTSMNSVWVCSALVTPFITDGKGFRVLALATACKAMTQSTSMGLVKGTTTSSMDTRSICGMEAVKNPQYWSARHMISLDRSQHASHDSVIQRMRPMPGNRDTGGQEL